LISSIDNTDKLIASQIWKIFQESYAIEAAILKATDFPPLKRTVENIMSSTNLFYGIYVNEEMSSVIEIKTSKTFIHIQSLVVKPKYFRRGLAGQLMNFILNTIQSTTYIVETGHENTPAKNLYLKLGFYEVQQWNTDHGIRKVRFKKTSTSTNKESQNLTS